MIPNKNLFHNFFCHHQCLIYYLEQQYFCLNFNTQCIKYKVIPNFARVGKLAERSFTPKEIEQAQHKKVTEALQNQRIYLMSSENYFNLLCSNLRPLFKTIYDYNKKINIIKTRVVQNEKFDDRKRSQKLEKLLLEEKLNFNKAEVHNFT